MSALGGRVLCVRCELPKLHEVHQPSVGTCEFVRPVVQKRAPQMARGKSRGFNTTVRGRSKKRADYLEATGYAERSAGARTQQCVVRSPVCTGQAQGLHHILARSAAGGLEAAERIGPKPVPACNQCQTYVEERGRAWALASGFKVTLKGRAA